MQTNNGINNGSKFEKIVAKLFRVNGYKVRREVLYESNERTSIGNKGSGFRYDIIASNKYEQYYVEVKYYRQKEVPLQMIERAISMMKRFYPSSSSILVVNGIVTGRERYEHDGVIIIDLPVLISFVSENEYLLSQLLSILDFSVADIDINNNDLQPYLLNSFSSRINQDDIISLDNIEKNRLVTKESNKGNLLILQLKTWTKTGAENFKEYEKLCMDVLFFLFADDLGLWEKQRHSNNKMFRFDLICKVKDDITNGFWNYIIDFFKSKFVVFEFKNYEDEITQNEIYVTEKYLYTKAFRSVAFIISCKGSNKNALFAARGILRETSKLIISLSNKDLIVMIESKMNGNSGTELLYNRLDKMLIELEK